VAQYAPTARNGRSSSAAIDTGETRCARQHTAHHVGHSPDQAHGVAGSHADQPRIVSVDGPQIPAAATRVPKAQRVLLLLPLCAGTRTFRCGSRTWATACPQLLPMLHRIDLLVLSPAADHVLAIETRDATQHRRELRRHGAARGRLRGLRTLASGRTARWPRGFRRVAPDNLARPGDSCTAPRRP
jgi:hypothetical protein